MPVSVGYHPYFQVTDRRATSGRSPRRAHRMAALAGQDADRRDAADRAVLPESGAVRLASFDLDHVFDDLVRDAPGRAVMSVKGKSQRLDVSSARTIGRRSSTRREGQEFICFEPMAAITNALNLAQRGVYKELQMAAPGETWRESFWIRPSGSETTVTTRHAALSSGEEERAV